MRSAVLLCAIALAAVPTSAEETRPTKPAAAAERAATAPVAAAAGAAAAVVPASKLSDPASLKEQAPASFKARFETTKGAFVIEVHREWSPNGADRLYNLVKNSYFDGVKFFRVVPSFVVQFGIHGDPAIATKWLDAKLPDDPVKQSNKRGYVTYAKSGAPNSRSVQLFINLKDNANLDEMGFAPLAQVVEGMDVVDALYSEYGEQVTSLQGQIASQGNAFLEQRFPKLDSIKTARILK